MGALYMENFQSLDLHQRPFLEQEKSYSGHSLTITPPPIESDRINNFFIRFHL